MPIGIRSLLSALLLTTVAHVSLAATEWVEGHNYFLIQPAQPTSVGPGKVEVTEVFSYACPACNSFYPVMDRLRQSLPADVVVDYVPASFNPTEDWPMFQRAYYTALVLGLINTRTHEAMFDAVWKTGELAVIQPGSNRLRVPAPSIVDAARFYAHAAGINPDTFIKTAASFGVDSRIRQADQFVRDCGVEETPTIIVNGTYRVTAPSAGSYDQLIELTKYLVSKITHG
jgi:protein dithiol oxidoreductase (disulfide-forming)